MLCRPGTANLAVSLPRELLSFARELAFPRVTQHAFSAPPNVSTECVRGAPTTRCRACRRGRAALHLRARRGTTVSLLPSQAAQLLACGCGGRGDAGGGTRRGRVLPLL